MDHFPSFGLCRSKERKSFVTPSVALPSQYFVMLLHISPCATIASHQLFESARGQKLSFHPDSLHSP